MSNIIKLTYPGLNPGQDSPMWINMDKVIKFENYGSKTQMWIEGLHSSIFIKETPEQIIQILKEKDVKENIPKNLNLLDLMEAIKRTKILSLRAYNILDQLYKYKGIKTVGQLIDFYGDTGMDLLKIRNCGRRTLIEIESFIELLIKEEGINND